MSSKGRGSPVVDSEFYPTPAWCTRRILEALHGDHNAFPVNGTWVEPCCGDGAISSVIREFAPLAHIATGDVRATSLPTGADVWYQMGFDEWLVDIGVAITNPPFSLAEPIIDHFLPRCDWLILLLRSSFKLVNSDGRDYRNNMPDEYKLPQRPEFIASLSCRERDAGGKSHEGCGWSAKLPIGSERPTVCPRCRGIPGAFRFIQCSTTDASEYSWFVWTPERGRRFGRNCVLPDTPLGERRER